MRKSRACIAVAAALALTASFVATSFVVATAQSTTATLPASDDAKAQ